MYSYRTPVANPELTLVELALASSFLFSYGLCPNPFRVCYLLQSFIIQGLTKLTCDIRTTIAKCTAPARVSINCYAS